MRDKDVLFLKHDPEDFIGLVLGGHLYTVLYGPDGRELIVNDIRPGEVIGENRADPAEPPRDLRLRLRRGVGADPPPTSLRPVDRRHGIPQPRAGPPLFAPARSLRFRREGLLHRLESRLARHLLASLASEQPEGACATLPTNQSILAAMLNASRPKLNAQLQIWKREGLISCRNDRILINDLGRLRRKAELPAAPLSPR
ncbi:putative transcriptional regulator [Pseudomonas aeruginosa]|nr:putative transcriptional regulator [Pseudomonas aeruginosa]